MGKMMEEKEEDPMADAPHLHYLPQQAMINNSINHRQTLKGDYDTLLADALSNMSVEERELLYEEIHGVSPMIQETEKMVVESLGAMETELELIQSKPVYDLALLQPSGRDYVTSRSFRLMFLRAQRFDAKKAADHLVTFLNGKLGMFGPETLGRRLYLSDLDEDDMSCLKSGIIQLLPKRDRAGRAVLLSNISDVKPEQLYKRPENFLKIYFFIGTAAVEDDEETQKKGVVAIGRLMLFDPSTTCRTVNVLQSFPFRMAAIHGLSDVHNTTVRAYLSISVATIGYHFRRRVKIHYGSHTERQYALMTFGIPTDDYPVSNDGELKVGNHLNWIERQKIRERHLRTYGHFHGIDIPGEKDVLAGRGSTCQIHPGNVKMRQLVSLQIDKYKEARCKAERDAAMNDIVNEVKSCGGRFLRRDAKGWWWEVNDDEARHRVTMAVRTCIAMSGPQQQQQQQREGSNNKKISSSSVSLEQQDDDHRQNRKKPRLDNSKSSSGCYCFFPSDPNRGLDNGSLIRF